MRIKSIRLVNYKRFTNLLIDDIPDTARLVVLVGPNGSGKSSLFDAFLLKSHGAKYNYRLERERADYYSKDTATSINTTHEVWQSIIMEFHSGSPTRETWPNLFNIRSAYRNEADFHLTTLNAVTPSTEKARFERIIDPDQAVSENYRRLTWQRMIDIDRDALAEKTIGEYRQEFLNDLQRAMQSLFTDPTLKLQDFGGIRDLGVFRFTKGTSKDFHYKNLSGGEKAAFDLLLDMFVKRSEFQNAVYCVDEPEAHVATGLHGPLLETMLDILPADSQLWIATHSIGFVRKAHDIMQRNGGVVFLDFSGHNFDQEVTMSPRIPDRIFWRDTYRVALDDLSELVAPANIVLCEGSRRAGENAFDATCFNMLFNDTHHDTLFISRGGSREVEGSEDVIAILHSVAKGATVWRLIDRDEMTSSARQEKIKEGVRVLGRREIENYLYDADVLQTFLKMINKEEHSDNILRRRGELLLSDKALGDNIKAISRDLFGHIKQTTRRGDLGNTREEFAKQHLTPALKNTSHVLHELKEDIFP